MEKTVSVKTESDTVKVAVITTENKIVTDDLAAPADNNDLELDDDISLAQVASEASSTNLSLAKLSSENEIKIKQMQRQLKSAKRYNAHLEHVPSDENDLAISSINSGDFGWKADVCKLQKHHTDYGSHCDAQMLAQVGSSSEMRDDKDKKPQEKKDEKPKEKAKPKFGDNSPEFKKAHEKVMQYSKKYKTADDIPDSELPESYDFTNIDGFDFTGPVRDQGACGSCYTVSFAQVIESRLKMKYGKEMPMLSSQYLMTCNYMNEGCDGGWSFFHGYLAENGHMVDETCAPYLGKTKGE